MGSHGQGTRVELPDGRWRVALTMAGGKRVWRRARTEAEAERILAELVEMRELDLDPSRLTLAAWLRSWIESLRDAKRQRLAPRTLEHYAMIVERHIIPGLDPRDRLPLTKVTERGIQAWLDATDKSPRTIHHHRAVLRRALNRAVAQRLLARNPAAGKSIELPDAAWHGQKPLSFDEARRFLSTSEGRRWHPLWRTALYTGLRLGELLGLTWDGLDPAGFLTVEGQMQRLNGAWVRTGTKAARTIERLAIDPVTVEVLTAHRERMARERQPGWRYFGHLFIDEDGEPHHRSDVRRAFLAACDEAGIERRRFHDLRASHLTMLRALGVPEDARMARAGHATTDMARRYAKASDAEDRAAVLALAEALG